VNGRLAGKIALITGASRGIGRAIAVRFAREGAVVAVNYRSRQDLAEEVVAAIRDDGGEALALQADVADQDQVAAMVDAIQRRYPRIDILVNNAGLFRPGQLQSITDEILDSLTAVNVKGLVHCSQAVVPLMIAHRYGKIVNIASIAGLGTTAADTTPYAATKAAVIALTKRFALELGPHAINVNAICPGFIVTEMGLTGSGGDLEAFTSRAILRRVGQPDDVAHASLFLASDEASFITAQVLTIDGGRMDFLSHSG
jgi:3-oxoacyl-[acyl-carrier protein] reductase